MRPFLTAYLLLWTVCPQSAEPISANVKRKNKRFMVSVLYLSVEVYLHPVEGIRRVVEEHGEFAARDVA